jgi:hypothetical protein
MDSLNEIQEKLAPVFAPISRAHLVSILVIDGQGWSGMVRETSEIMDSLNEIQEKLAPVFAPNSRTRLVSILVRDGQGWSGMVRESSI